MSEKSKIFDKIEGDVIASFSGETPNEPSPFEEQIDDEMSIFDYALLENEALSEKEGDAQIQQNEGEPSEQNNAEEKKEEDAKDEKEKDENSERQEQRYGKFKNPEELLHAYQELEKEFTRRSQKLRELENANSEPFASEEEWRAAVDKFFEETPSAKPFARDIANEILSHPELKKDRNCLSVALTRTLANKFRTPEQLMSDGQFLKDYVLCSKEVKDAVIAEYLQGIRANEVPFVLSSGGMQCVTNPKGPRTIEEAGFMFLKDNQ